MTCVHVQRQLTRYLERMCEKSEVATIARHIESCPACAQQLAELQRVKSLIHQMRNFVPDPFILSDITMAICERTTHAPPGTGRRVSFIRRSRYMIAAAAVVFLAAVTIMWHLIDTPSSAIVQNPGESDDMTIYLQEHALHADQSLFSNGAYGSMMVRNNGNK